MAQTASPAIRSSADQAAPTDRAVSPRQLAEDAPIERSLRPRRLAEYIGQERVKETLQVFIDDNKIADYQKAMPADLVFTALSFTAGGNHGDNDKFYLGNIKISKD